MEDWDGTGKKLGEAYVALLAECALMVDSKLASVKHIEQLKSFDMAIRRDVSAHADDIEIQKEILTEANTRLGGLLVHLMFIKRLKIVPQDDSLFWNPKREKIEDVDGFDWSSNNLKQ